ncbi:MULTISPECIES: hypothetical protein [unclassified Photobacterium]|uniref:hypothetical protein n=1 Tax=unclassified Photobacterium TaxID=2628852 RepID=UPI001B8D7B6E|nr:MULTISPECIES: hypothetical protein [unclassified Photobacterium]MDO6705143.1 hypothetical protein [Photobacterium sp. 1_MG-2023]QUJ66659.1 hypothetical protein KDD30_10865 [Photobacterium sp. GJ3]
MFLLLLVVTFAVSVGVCFLVSQLFSQPIESILKRLVAPDLSFAWTKYLTFAIYVVGVSGGVRIYSLENFIREPSEDFTPPVLTTERWVLEIYRTLIESLQSIAWMLLVFFIFSLIAYVIVRGFELRYRNPDE